MRRNDIKCKYMLMFTLKNLARKGLINVSRTGRPLLSSKSTTMKISDLIRSNDDQSILRCLVTSLTHVDKSLHILTAAPQYTSKVELNSMLWDALGPVSISDKTSYRKISWSLEAARLVVQIIASLWNLTGTSAALLPRCLSNFEVIRQF